MLSLSTRIQLFSEGRKVKRVAHKSKPAERPLVDIAVPCLPYQSSKWWPKIMSLILSEDRYGKVEINKITAVSSALVDSNKNM